jgi:hypothetical protein
MDLTDIKFSHDPLGLSGLHNQIMQVPKTEYKPSPPTYHYETQYLPKKESNGLKYFLWGLGILAIIIGVIIWVNSSKEVYKTLYLADKETWDLDYIEAKKKENKAEYKKDVGWVIYK